MKIYIVTDGEYSDYGISAVFTDKKKAETYCAMHGDQVEIWETSDDDIEGNIDLHYMFEIYESKNEPPILYETVKKLSPKNKNQIVHERFPSERYHAEVWLTKDDPELAFKIGKDMIAEYKAKEEGISI